MKLSIFPAVIAYNVYVNHNSWTQWTLRIYIVSGVVVNMTTNKNKFKKKTKKKTNNNTKMMNQQQY